MIRKIRLLRLVSGLPFPELTTLDLPGGVAVGGATEVELDLVFPFLLFTPLWLVFPFLLLPLPLPKLTLLGGWVTLEGGGLTLLGGEELGGG
jgi:hypothetical protein